MTVRVLNAPKEKSCNIKVHFIGKLRKEGAFKIHLINDLWISFKKENKIHRMVSSFIEFGFVGAKAFDFFLEGIFSQNAPSYTARKVSVFGVSLVRIFPHWDWIQRSLCIQSECGKMRIRKFPNKDTFQEVLVVWQSSEYTFIFLQHKTISRCFVNLSLVET